MRADAYAKLLQKVLNNFNRRLLIYFYTVNYRVRDLYACIFIILIGSDDGVV